MNVTALDIPQVKLIEPVRHGDQRGFFSEVWSKRKFHEVGIDLDFVQDNHSMSSEQGVVRGLHFQAPPHAQTKLVRVARGSILDVAVDIRKGSPTFGQHVAVMLCSENWKQLLVPRGFAHGYCTLEPNTEVLYKVDNDYAPQSDGGIYWADPALKIDWPVTPQHAIVSQKDQNLPQWDQFDSPFFDESQDTRS